LAGVLEKLLKSTNSRNQAASAGQIHPKMHTKYTTHSNQASKKRVCYNPPDMQTSYPARGDVKAVRRPDPDALRDALRFWTTGVSIVSARHESGVHGMTVNSFTSVSLEPPLVMVSLEKITRTHGYVQAAGAFAVTILSAEQRALSDRFAGRETEHDDRFEGIEFFTLETGSPILNGGLAFFDCRVKSAHSAGTHTLFIGEVLAAGSANQAPLVYFNRDYRRLADL
jgi:flavin reductase (DIM6/NTAB) family NADH-FMN oxidoreductase RutF